MKKLAAILLLALMAFNFLGYKLWFYYAAKQSEQQLQASLDKKDYDEQDLVTIKIPLSLPYFIDWKEFESYNGSMEVDGKHYNYVKRKVFKDTLVLLCIPNEDRNRLVDAENKFAGLQNGQAPANKSNNASFLVLKTISEIGGPINHYYLFTVFHEYSNEYKQVDESTISNGLIPSPWHPPKLTA